MFIADTHADTLYAMGVQALAEGERMITPARLREGGVRLQTLALWTGPQGSRGPVSEIVARELAALRILLQTGLRQVDDPREALTAVAEEICCMLSVEGGEVFEAGPDTVDELRAQGVRMAAILWNHENALGYSAKSGDPRGLKPYGLTVVRRMQEAGMAVDVSHLNEAGFWDILNKTDVPPLASHSCCRSLCAHCRNLTDEQLRALIDGGGYVGVNFYPWFLSEDGRADADRVAEHIDHICQLGGAGIVGFGSDFDGIEVTPKDLRHAGEIPNLLEALRRRGYGEEAVAGIAGGNLLRYYDRIAQGGPCC